MRKFRFTFPLCVLLCPLALGLLSNGCKKTDTDPVKPVPQNAASEPAPSEEVVEPDYSQTDGVVPLETDFLEEEDGYELIYTTEIEEATSTPPMPEPEILPPTVETPAEADPVPVTQTLTVDLVDPVRYIDQGGVFWDAIYLGSQHIGYQATSYSVPTVQNKPILKVRLRNQINALRLGTPLEITSATQAFESLGGELISAQTKIQSETASGSSEIDHTAQVKDDKLVLSTRIGEAEAVEAELPWRAGSRTGGPDAIQISLLKNPIEKQEQRRITFYDASNFSFVEASLTAGEVETVDILGKPLNLRRIDAKLQYQQGAAIPYTLWTDANGNIIRSARPFAGEEMLITIRTNQKNAKSFENNLSSIDFAQLPLVPLPQLPENARERHTMSFDLAFKDEDAATEDRSELFPVTAFQSVKRIAPNRYQITVLSTLRFEPNSETLQPLSPAKFSQEDLGTSLWILPEDARTRDIAERIVLASENEWAKAVALEKWVNENMTLDTARGLESSAEIAESLKGDATKYAFLLTALLRSQKIPARIAFGYVSTKLNAANPEEGSAMAFHVWNEAMIDGVWIPLDASMGLGGASPDRIKLADSNLETGSFHAMTEVLLQTAGNLLVEGVK